MPWIPHAPTEPALIAVAVPDVYLADTETLIDAIEHAKRPDDPRRPEDIIFAMGYAVLARYEFAELQAFFKDRRK